MVDDSSDVIRFPYSRVSGSSRNRTVKDLGLTPLAQSIDPAGNGATGHWCSQCKGIWYGYFLETECPVCGNRQG